MKAKLQKFFEIVNSDQVEQLARSKKFVQRSSNKLRGKPFLALLLHTCLTGVTNSLSLMTGHLKRNYNISITKEGLNKRFSQKSVDFLFGMLSVLLQIKVTEADPILDKLSIWCKGVYLSDSTGFKLPNCLAKDYPGSGGGVKAQAKLYYEYDLLTHNPVAYKVSGGTTNDTLLMKTEGFVSKVLYMFDLGFYTKGRLLAIAHQGAYLLTRQKRNAAVWLEDAQAHQKILLKCCKKEGKTYKEELGIYLTDLVKHFKMSKDTSKVIPVYLESPKTQDRVLFYLHITKLPAEAQQSKKRQLIEKKENLNWKKLGNVIF